jgi:ATPase family associated with various cellular activities (AAA)
MDVSAAPSARDAILDLEKRVNQDIIGQERVVERLIIALLANGNVLLEGLPGLAKTRAIKSLSKNLESDFSRIQFTPDLLPSDVTGGEILRPDGQFEFRKGPVFGNLVLADEVNRAPAKVQSALLEAMEERHVTVAGKQYDLPPLFMVLATQNPIEQEGTYPLPEAQMDRFLMHVRIDYPSDQDEAKVMRLVRGREQHRADAAADRTKENSAEGGVRCPVRDRSCRNQGDGRDLYGGTHRGNAAPRRIRRPAEALDRDRCEPAWHARAGQMRAHLCLAQATRLCHARGCSGGDARLSSPSGVAQL